MANQQQFENNVSLIITEFLNREDTQISVANTDGLQTLLNGDYYIATIVPAGGHGSLEIVKIISVSGNTLSVQRAQEGTSAQNFLFGSLIELRITAGTLENLLTDGGASNLPVGGLYQVQANKTINDPLGRRYTARGAQMFDYAFVSFEARTNMLRRNPFGVPDSQLPVGYSLPSYGARRNWVSYEYAEAQIKAAQKTGVNFIRLCCEPASQFTPSYIDPIDGKRYPGDMECIDHIISVAGNLGMVVQVQTAQDNCTDGQLAAFAGFIAQRYYKLKHVWINPANEPGATFNGGAHILDAPWWVNRIQTSVIAIRTPFLDETGKQVQFLNPIAIDPPGYAHRLDLAKPYLDSYGTFTTDPNLVINIHMYGAYLESSWQPRISPGGGDYDAWYVLRNQYPIMMAEVGLTNFGDLDPLISPGGVSPDPANFAAQKSIQGEFWRWLDSVSYTDVLNGGVARLWLAGYDGANPSGPFTYDSNCMYMLDGTITAFGSIVKTYFYAAPQNWQYARRRLGSQPDGTWGTGDIAQDAVTNSKLGNMSANTVKGAITTGDPVDLTRTQLSQAMWGLGATAATSGPIGTPFFQAEGSTGARAAAVLIQQGVSDTYLGFYNRTTGNTVGTVTGNGTTGVVYGTTSDYRLKTNIKTADPLEALQQIKKVRVVKAGWKDYDPKITEYMYLAHEYQEVNPNAVTGFKDEQVEIDGKMVPKYQNVDYGKGVPLLTAAVQALITLVETQTLEIADLQSKVKALTK